MSWVPIAIGTPDDGGREDEGRANEEQQRRKESRQDRVDICDKKRLIF